uniref:Uncharacterized protein n=1 Tax=Sorghum bicolor TaxID=4558 RepID=C6JRZ2_SORBI
MEEMKARQRSRDRNIIEGDKNIAYFQAVANQRNRKKRICGLDGPDGWIDDNSKMLIHAVDFYKSLFGQDESSEVKLDSNFWGEEERVTCEEAKLLEANFSEEEVKDAVFGSYADGAPGPDGLPFLFYQTFWEVIKKDLMRLIDCFCDACLASIPIYLLSVIKFPRWAIDMNNSQMGHFLWNDSADHHKYHLANWQLVSQKKDVGGLGSWIFRYQLNNNAIWRNIVDFKYKREERNVFCCPNVGTSPFRKGVLWAMKAAHMGIKWVIGDVGRYRRMYSGFNDVAMGGDNEEEVAAEDDRGVDAFGDAIRDAQRECESDKEKAKFERMLEDHRKSLYPTTEEGQKSWVPH